MNAIIELFEAMPVERSWPYASIERDEDRATVNLNLHIYITEITWFPSRVVTVTLAGCSGLTKLPDVLPTTVAYLDVSHTRIAKLPALSSLRLMYLNCDSTPIEELPELPDTLEGLRCHRSGLKVLPKLPRKLEHLDCSYSRLEVLPALPEELMVLNCIGCRLRTLPPIPESLRKTAFRCQDNPYDLGVNPEDVPEDLRLLVPPHAYETYLRPRDVFKEVVEEIRATPSCRRRAAQFEDPEEQ